MAALTVPILGPDEWLRGADAMIVPLLSAAEEAECRLGFRPYLASVADVRVLPHDWLLLGDHGLLIESLDAQMPLRPTKAHHIAAASGGRATLELPDREARFAGPCVLLGNHPAHYHWLTYYLPRLIALERASALADLPLVVGDSLTAGQAEALRVAGVDERRLLRLAGGAVYRFDELWVPSLLTWRLTVHPVALRWLRRTFLGTAAPAAGRRRVFVSRRDASMRQLLNEDEVAALLARHGFETVAAARLGFGAQARLFGEAEWVVGGTGSGLSNVVFAPPGTTVVELHNNDAADFIEALCPALGQRYVRIMGAIRPEHGKLVHDCDFTVPLAPLEALLRDCVRSG